MEKNRTVIDIKELLSAQAEVVSGVEKKTKKIPFFQSNPIYKKLLSFSNDKLKDKFTLKDLFR